MFRRALFALLQLGSTACATTVCTKGPCGPGNEKCVGPKPQQYVFHLSDETCAINDPNGPFYDEVHGMYHNFYQDHLAEPQAEMGPGRGPDWGHWISRDFLHWARLPVAIWNDQWYDAVAIFSGSTTIVDGKPVIVYPGLCNKTNCPHGSTYAVAVPADPSDPTYTNWSKPSYNPIVQATGDDPSTAWKTKDGEWRLIGNQGGGPGAPIYGSMDFKTWYKVGFTTLRLGDCPTFFPRPALTPGSEAHFESLSDEERDALPNWVHKAGSGNDQVQVGTWTDGKPGTPPSGTGATPGTWEQKGGSTPLDNGKTHASKDFYDPTTGRRIMWVWGTLPNGIQTIPREMTYDPRTNKINYAPVAEMKQLRSKQPIAVLSAEAVAPGKSLVLKASSASDIELTFEKPAKSATFNISFAGGMLYFNYTTEAATAAVGYVTPAGSAAEAAILAAEPPATRLDQAAPSTNLGTGAGPKHNLTTMMVGVDLGGNDMGGGNSSLGGCWHLPLGTQATVCEEMCRQNDQCSAWVWVIRGSPAGSGDCCLKRKGLQSCPRPNPKCTSGVLTPTTACKEPGHGGGGGGKRGKGMQDSVDMLATDTHITFRLFLDTAVAEAYFMGGRVAMTIPVPAATAVWDVSISADHAVQLTNASSWGMSSIYVTKAKVLATPRRAVWID